MIIYELKKPFISLMKTIILNLFSILFVFVSFTVSANEPCAKDEYPDLHTSAYLPDEVIGGSIVSYVVHTIPFTKVDYAGKGAMYQVKHPDPNNECNEITTTVADDEYEFIRVAFDISRQYPRAAKKCDITLVLTYINGKTDGNWKVHAIGKPINPEEE